MNRYLFIIAAAVLLASCASLNTRRNKYVSTHPGLTPDQRDNIKKGEVAPGMTPDMVTASWGKPIDVKSEKIDKKHTAEDWIYEKHINYRIFTNRVRFVNGIVTEVKLLNQRQRVYSTYNRRYYWEYSPRFH